MIQVQKIFSPNFNDRPKGIRIDTIVLHYTDTESLEESLEYLTREEHQVSAHYLIDTDGSLYQLVDDKKRAWHAGISHWKGVDNINHNSIGIEIQNAGFKRGKWHPFPEKQIDILLKLLNHLIEKHDIPTDNIIGHSDIAPERKIDPGPLFPWELLYEKGFGYDPQKRRHPKYS